MRLVIRQTQLKRIALFILAKTPNTRAYFNGIALSGGLSTKQPEIKLAELRDKLGSVTIASPATNKVNDADYFSCKIAQQLCQTYHLNFDFDLIEKIRLGTPLNYPAHSGDNLNLTIVHIYLALLYRFPSATEIEHDASRVIKKNSFETVFETLVSLSEYKQRGRKELIA